MCSCFSRCASMILACFPELYVIVSCYLSANPGDDTCSRKIYTSTNRSQLTFAVLSTTITSFDFVQRDTREIISIRYMAHSLLFSSLSSMLSGHQANRQVQHDTSKFVRLYNKIQADLNSCRLWHSKNMAQNGVYHRTES